MLYAIITSPFHHHYITITSPLCHHYITITSPLHHHLCHHYITITSPLHHHCVTITSPLRHQEERPLPGDGVDVLLPLTVQKGKHFAEKFTTEDSATFWYRDEKGIVSASTAYTLAHTSHPPPSLTRPSFPPPSLPPSLNPSLLHTHTQELLPPYVSSADESSEEEFPPEIGYEDQWELGDLPSPGELDMSDLWVTDDTVPLTDTKRRSRKFSLSRKRKPSTKDQHPQHRSSLLRHLSLSRRREEDQLRLVEEEEPVGEPDVLSDKEMESFKVPMCVHRP